MYEIVYIAPLDNNNSSASANLGYLVLFETELKKMKKIHLVRLVASQKKKDKVESIDTYLFKKPAEKKVSVV